MKQFESLSAILNSSEMYCSLRYEDFRGCPYNMFDSFGIGMLAVSCSLLAALSLLVTV